MAKTVSVNGYEIGFNQPPFMIAEVSCNHMGSFERAKDIMRAAQEAGADAVKLQTYTAKTLTMNGPQKHFQIDHPLWNNMSLHNLYAKAETPFEWMKPLFDFGEELGITVFSAPFDITAAQLLIDLDVPLFKIASFEAVHLPLIKKVAATKKPLIISTGMANEQEIDEALETARAAGCEDIILLHCISAYPTPKEEANLRTIEKLRDRFGVLVGLSDHTTDTLVAELAVGLGACVVEKHIMLNANDESFDKEFSLIPSQFAELVEKCKAQTSENFKQQCQQDDVQKILGVPGFQMKDGEKNSTIFRPSILVAQDIKAGEIFTEENLIIRRPSAGMAPKHWDDLMGKVAACDLEYGDAMHWDHVCEVSDTIKKA